MLQAQKKLEACRTRMLKLIQLAVKDANELVDANGKILGPIPTFGTLDGCEGRPPSWPKCKVLFSFGILLHASQDFYAHSNWVDIASGPITEENPPGLGQSHRAAWLDLRRDHPFPTGLLSGCYLGEPEDFYCKQKPFNSVKYHRVRHKMVNKDRAESAGDFTEHPFHVGKGSTPRGAHDNNFARAVLAAVEDTEDKWTTLREALIHRYGQARGGKMICVISRDDPKNAC